MEVVEDARQRLTFMLAYPYRLYLCILATLTGWTWKQGISKYPSALMLVISGERYRCSPVIYNCFEVRGLDGCQCVEQI